MREFIRALMQLSHSSDFLVTLVLLTSHRFIKSLRQLLEGYWYEQTVKADIVVDFVGVRDRISTF